MPVFRYRALNENREIVKGFVDAINADAVAELLLDRKLTIVGIQEVKKAPGRIKLPFFGHVRKKSLVIFARQLAVMLTATVPVVQALRILSAQTDDKALKNIVSEMANDVDGGMKLSSAFGKHPGTFSNFFVAMIRSGETSGRLDKVLVYLADQNEKDYALLSKIRGAMVYPIFILSALISVGVIMIIFVVPSMTSLLKESGAELPFMTRMLITTSDILKVYWWALLAAVIAFVIGLQAFLRTDYGRQRWDEGKLYIPVFGNLFKKIILSRFATSLSTLIKGGVPISRALDITGDVVSNHSFKAVIAETVKEVEDGNSITTAFAKSSIVPTMLPQMLSVGERTGRMDEVLDRVGDFYSQEVDTLIGSLTSLIEPMIMIILGIGVGVMVAAIILPMFQIANSIS